jgi:hypothetical protein
VTLTMPWREDTGRIAFELAFHQKAGDCPDVSAVNVAVNGQPAKVVKAQRVEGGTGDCVPMLLDAPDPGGDELELIARDGPVMLRASYRYALAPKVAPLVSHAAPVELRPGEVLAFENPEPTRPVVRCSVIITHPSGSGVHLWERNATVVGQQFQLTVPAGQTSSVTPANLVMFAIYGPSQLLACEGFTCTGQGIETSSHFFPITYYP